MSYTFRKMVHKYPKYFSSTDSFHFCLFCPFLFTPIFYGNIFCELLVVCTGSQGLDAVLRWSAIIFPCVHPLLRCVAFFLDFILDCAILFQCYYLSLICILCSKLFYYSCFFPLDALLCLLHQKSAI